jgi:hypothetical protein
MNENEKIKKILKESDNKNYEDNKEKEKLKEQYSELLAINNILNQKMLKIKEKVQDTRNNYKEMIEKNMRTILSFIKEYFESILLKFNEMILACKIKIKESENEAIHYKNLYDNLFICFKKVNKVNNN